MPAGIPAAAARGRSGVKAIVTGSQSFIGKALREACMRRGVEWFGVDALPARGSGEIQADIRDPELVKQLPEQADVMIHLAAVSRDQDCRRDPGEAFAINVGGTLNVIAAARERRIRQFIFASSEWVYGEVGNQEIQTEGAAIDATRIVSEYALSKIAGERLLAMAQSQGAFDGATVLRFGIVYGPRPSNWSAVEALFDAVWRGGVVEVKGSLGTSRRFIHVEDVAEGILAAVGRRVYEVFNLSGNDLISLGDVIGTSADLLGRSPQILEGKPEAVSIRNPDNGKAQRELGWAPQRNLRQGLATLMEGLRGVEQQW